MTAVVITTTADVPTVGGDEDVWGGKNNAKWGTARADLLALATTPANTIKGNNTGGAQGVDDLTPAQVAAMLPAFTGDSGSGGVKGSVPAPASGDAAANKVLGADGAWRTMSAGLAGFVGSSGAAIGVASNLTCVRAGTGDYDISFVAPLPNTNYAVFVSINSITPNRHTIQALTTGGFTINTLDVNTVAAYDPDSFFVRVERLA